MEDGAGLPTNGGVQFTWKMGLDYPHQFMNRICMCYYVLEYVHLYFIHLFKLLKKNIIFDKTILMN